MFKAMILLTRKPEVSRQEFEHWWLVRHRPLAAQLPKLKRGVFNLVADGQDTGIDGVSELWFDNHQDFEAAYASEIGNKVAEDSLSNVAGRTRLIVVETEVVDNQ